MQSSATTVVSVLIPLFNHEHYIIACLNSIKEQSYDPIELIIIDDGSTDDSFEIASKWISNNKRHFVHCDITKQSNCGITRTLNKLVHKSNGFYIYPIASDDIVADNAIAKLVSFYSDCVASPELIITDVALIDECGNMVASSAAISRRRNIDRMQRNKRFLKREIILKWGIPFFHQFYTRQLYDEIGGYDETLDFEDMYFALRAAALNRIRFTSIISKHYRIRTDRSTTPGIEAGFSRDIHARRRVRALYSPIWRLAFNILNLRDKDRNGRFVPLMNLLISAMRFVARVTA